MSGYINSIRKAIGKGVEDIKFLSKDTDEAVPPLGRDEAGELPPTPLGPSPFDPEKSSFNIPRTGRLLEEMGEEPPPNIMEMGRPDDGHTNLQLMQEDPKIRQATQILDSELPSLKRETPVTHADLIKSADDVKVLTKLLGKPDTHYNDVDMVSLAQIHREVTENLTTNVRVSLDKILDDTISHEELMVLSHMEDVALEIQAKWVNTGTEAGRTLRARAALQESPSSPMYRDAAKEILDLKGGRTVLKERLKLYAEGKSFEDLIYNMKMSRGEKIWKGIFFLRYNSMLSGFATHSANVIGSTSVLLNETLIIKPLTVMFNKLEQGPVGRRLKWLDGGKALDLPIEDAMLWREMVPHVRASVAGLGRGLRGFSEMIRGKAITDGKFFNEVGSRYDINNVPKFYKQDSVPKTLGKAGKFAMGSVTRALEAEDAVFRSIAYNMELARLVKRRVNHIENPEDANRIALELIKYPTDDLHIAAKEYSQYAVFANDPNLYSNVFGWITTQAGKFQQSAKMAQVIMPFVRVIGNLAIYGKNHSFGFLSSRLWQDVVGNDPRRRAEGLARMTESAGIGIVAHHFWEEGKITGAGSPDRDARAAASRAGYPPNSIQIDGEWYNISRLDPFGLSIALWATAFENMEANDGDPATAVVDTMLSMGQLLQDRAMLSSVANVFEVLSGEGSPSTKADVIASLMPLTPVVQPGILRTARHMVDSTRRQMEAEDNVGGWWERTKARVMNGLPGLSDNLPPKRDWRGNIVVNQATALFGGVLPIPRVKSLTDEGTLALLQFNINIGKPDKILSLPHAGLKLNILGIDDGAGWAYNKYSEIIGIAQSKMIDSLMGSDFKKNWKEAIKNGVVADGIKYEIIQDVLRSHISKARQLGRLEFLKWLDGREAIPGRTIDDETGERQQIPVTEVFRSDNYIELDIKVLQEEIDIQDLEIYTKRGTTTLPAIQKTIDQNIEF